MTSGPELWQSHVFKNLQRMSEARGLTFYVKPPRDVVPRFLGDFQPEAMARGPEGGIIIETMVSGSSAREQQLAEIARRVSGQKGWEFRVITLNPPIDAAPPIAGPTPRQLHDAFKEVEALAQGGHTKAALVIGWAALEALARQQSGGHQGLSSLQVVQTLAEEGHLESKAVDRLCDMTGQRDAVIHGDFSVDVPAEQVDYLLRQLRAIATEVGGAQA